MTDETHDPSLRSWVESANDSGTDFPIQNLPLVRFRHAGRIALGAAIGDRVLDITAVFGVTSVTSMSRADRQTLRRDVSRFLSADSGPAYDRLVDDPELLLPCDIPDYTDFYASIHHATNVGSMFRPDHPLLPNYKWLPVGYHGRASSVVVSGTAVRRPWGQIADDPAGPPVFAPSRRLDYELEVGLFLGPGNPLGQPIPVAQARDHMVGICLLNDWSARDIQSWEYQPLGPFLAKSFATSVSPWMVTLEALEPFRCAADPRPPADPQPLPHLTPAEPAAYDITLEVWLQSTLVSRSYFRTMYWTFAQMVAHHSSNGCPLTAGSLIGSGTVSGAEKSNRGCLLELTWRGTEPLQLGNGQTRRFLEDGDQVVFRGFCEAPGYRRIGLGECRGVMLPALTSAA